MDKKLILLLISNAFASVGTGIAMIAVPWFIASSTNGGLYFGILITACNIVLLFITPFIGAYIDSTSRKLFTIWLRVIFIILISIIAIYQTFNHDNDLPALVAYYFFGAAFYVINIPLRTAFVQELFNKQAYQRVNSILEIEGQVGSVIVAGLAVLAINYITLVEIIFIHIICYLVAIACVSFIEYPNNRVNIVRKGGIKDVVDGMKIMAKMPILTILLVSSCIPYVTVITYTYIHPVLLSSYLNAQGSDYALVELLFGLGAIVAGICLGFIQISGRNRLIALFAALFFFTCVALIQALFPLYLIVMVCAMLLGFGNSLVRVIRQSLLMNEINIDEIGRVGSVLQSFIMLFRVIALLSSTAMTVTYGVVSAVWFVAALCLIATLVYWISYKKGHHEISRET